MSEPTPARCVCCGSAVRVVSSGEGTSHYEPVTDDHETAADIKQRWNDGTDWWTNTASVRPTINWLLAALAAAQQRADGAEDERHAYQETVAAKWAERTRDVDRLESQIIGLDVRLKNALAVSDLWQQRAEKLGKALEMLVDGGNPAYPTEVWTDADPPIEGYVCFFCQGVRRKTSDPEELVFEHVEFCPTAIARAALAATDAGGTER